MIFALNQCLLLFSIFPVTALIFFDMYLSYTKTKDYKEETMCPIRQIYVLKNQEINPLMGAASLSASRYAFLDRHIIRQG